MAKQLSTEEAIVSAIELIERAHGSDNPETRETVQRLEMLLRQKGCEHFDPACNGRLVDLVDIIIDG